MLKHKTRKNLQKIAHSEKSGFTMIEFSIATAFIAVLLISIAIITSNLVTTYQKGISLKAINSVGRGLIDEFTRTINATSAVDTTSLCDSHFDNVEARNQCKADNANKFVFQQYPGTRVAPGHENGGHTDDVQFGGIFCTGKYSYIWNTYYSYEAKDSGKMLKLDYLSSKNGGTNETKDGFRLIRINDPTYRACSSRISTNAYKTVWEGATVTDQSEDTIDITKLSNGVPNEIEPPQEGFLSSFDLDLWLYELAMFPISQNNITYRTFMSGTFILATERGNINITRSAEYCDINNYKDDETASDILNIGSEFNYCAINKFNFAARTAGM